MGRMLCAGIILVNDTDAFLVLYLAHEYFYTLRGDSLTRFVGRALHLVHKSFEILL